MIKNNGCVNKTAIFRESDLMNFHEEVHNDNNKEMNGI